jgi:glycosyltransferase involved in cell wall biosynthesis
LVYPFEKIRLVKHIDSHSDIIFAFSEYWKKNLIDMGVSSDKIKILSHGFDNRTFFQIDTNDAKKYFNFNSEDFIILNTNRNNYRKAIDKTIDVFIRFLKIKNIDKKIKLFLNMNINDGVGYDILNQVEINCIENNLDHNHIINNHIFTNQSFNGYTDLQLNILYNACDVGINTCVGEGFGLCNLEHGSLGKPQIISNIGGLSDIFKPEYSYPINPIERLYVSNEIDYHGGYIEICPTDEFVKALVSYHDDHELRKTHGIKCMEVIGEKYIWDNILNEFNDTIINNM